jgi:hypothetical protein
MANKGKTQLIITWVASPDQVSEVDRLVESHGSFMSKSHDRDGSNALLSYDLAKGPELENPLDPSSNSTGNTRYVLSEVYDSPAPRPETELGPAISCIVLRPSVRTLRHAPFDHVPTDGIEALRHMDTLSLWVDVVGHRQLLPWTCDLLGARQPPEGQHEEDHGEDDDDGQLHPRSGASSRRG